VSRKLRLIPPAGAGLGSEPGAPILPSRALLDPA
jgi:hypothetical protein